MLAALDVVNRLKELKINALHIKLRARGGFFFIRFFSFFLIFFIFPQGTDTKTPGPGAQSALRALARFGSFCFFGFVGINFFS